MIRFIKVAIHVTSAVILGCLVALLAIQEDPWFKEKLEHMLKASFSKMVQAPVSCNIKSIDLLKSIIIVDDLSVHAYDNRQWSFTCPRLVLRFSWSSILLRFCIEAELDCYKPEAHSCIEGSTLALSRPLKLIAQAPTTVPFRLKKCSLYNAKFSITDTQDQQKAVLNFSSDTLFGYSTMRTTIVYTDGAIYYTSELSCQALAGTLSVDLGYEEQVPLAIKMELNLVLPFMDTCNRFLLTGNYKLGQGIFEAYTLDRSLSITLGKLQHVNGTWSGELDAYGLLQPFQRFVPITINRGSAVFRGSFEYAGAKNYSYSGIVSVTDLLLLNMLDMPFTKISINGNAEKAVGIYEVILAGGKVTGSGRWQATVSPLLIKTDFMTTQELAVLPGWTIKPGEAYCSCEINPGATSTCSYTVRCSKQENEKAQLFSGTITQNGKDIICTGNSNTLPFKVTGRLSDKHILSCIIGKLVILHYNSKTNALEGEIAFDVVNQIALSLGYALQGDGKISAKIVGDTQKCSIILTLHNGTIKIPTLYNTIQEAKLEFDIERIGRKVICKNCMIKLNKGMLSCSRAILLFSDSGKLVNAHIPVVFDQCLVSWQKDFFAIATGNLTLIYSNCLSLTGCIMLNESHLRTNLFSSHVQKELFKANMRPLTGYANESLLDIKLATCKPIHVKTPFLDAKAHLDIAIQGCCASPEISGTIDFSEGILAFPYKPLYITHARVYLMPNQVDDASIELIAKNRIKKYSITLHVSGSIHQPSFSFEASPALQDEQILTLLLAGSEEGSLLLVMPAMIMHTLESLLFGSPETLSQVQKSLKTMLQPLKHIRIIPDSRDPNRRLKGAIEIDINDRLRASVQRGLDTSQDTQVEVEYNLSDDVSIRGVKGDQGTVSGEVEMRWKF